MKVCVVKFTPLVVTLAGDHDLLVWKSTVLTKEGYDLHSQQLEGLSLCRHSYVNCNRNLIVFGTWYYGAVFLREMGNGSRVLSTVTKDS